MSNRTASATKAVADRWAQEQELVSKGQCTRDWSREQQQDILEKGKAYDENGKAIEGHHMKSVERFPEYQSDLGNIQFLTRAEHRSAHGGNFQNYTNGKYDYLSGNTIDFGDGPFEPCTIFDLSDPIKKIDIVDDTTSDDSSDTTEQTTQATDPPDHKQDENYDYSSERKASSPDKSSSVSMSGFRNGVKRIANAIKEFPTRHPVLTAIGGTVISAAVGYAVDKATSGGGSGGSGGGNSDYSSSYSDNPDDSDVDSSDYSDTPADDSNDDNSDRSGTGKGTPKAPHDTSGYTRRRNGREEHVRGYSTGKNRKDE